MNTTTTCTRCNSAIEEGHFDRGEAVRMEGRPYCPVCTQKLKLVTALTCPLCDARELPLFDGHFYICRRCGQNILDKETYDRQEEGARDPHPVRHAPPHPLPRCRECAGEIPPGVRRCRHCGTRIGGLSTAGIGLAIAAGLLLLLGGFAVRGMFATNERDGNTAASDPRGGSRDGASEEDRIDEAVQRQLATLRGGGSPSEVLHLQVGDLRDRLANATERVVRLETEVERLREQVAELRGVGDRVAELRRELDRLREGTESARAALDEAVRTRVDRAIADRITAGELLTPEHARELIGRQMQQEETDRTRNQIAGQHYNQLLRESDLLLQDGRIAEAFTLWREIPASLQGTRYETHAIGKRDDLAFRIEREIAAQERRLRPLEESTSNDKLREAVLVYDYIIGKLTLPGSAERTPYEERRERLRARLSTPAEREPESGPPPEPPQDGSPTPERIVRWIGELGSADIAAEGQAFQALLDLGSAAVPHLIEGLGSGTNGMGRSKMAGLLGEIGDPLALDALMAAADAERESDRLVREEAILALGKLGSKRAIPLLIATMDAEGLPLARSCHESLQQITGQSFRLGGNDAALREAVGRWRQWWENDRAAPETPPPAED